MKFEVDIYIVDLTNVNDGDLSPPPLRGHVVSGAYAALVNPRTGGGGVDFNPPPSGFSQIAKKRRRVAPPNLP